jgi:hypothetical protein
MPAVRKNMIMSGPGGPRSHEPVRKTYFGQQLAQESFAAVVRPSLRGRASA